MKNENINESHVQSLTVEKDDENPEQEKLANKNKNFFTFFGIFMGISACFYFYEVSQKEKLIFSECGQCKMGFFSSFYFYLLNNIAMLSISLLNFSVKFYPDKQTSILLFKSFKNILIIFGAQMFFSLIFFILENFYCSLRMQDFLINLFVYQILQFTA